MDDLTPNLHVAAYEVTCLPADHPATRHFTIRVDHHGGDRWAVTWRGMSLNHELGWDPEERPIHSTEEWLTDHRFALLAAFHVAGLVINDLTVNGLTAAQVLARGDR